MDCDQLAADTYEAMVEADAELMSRINPKIKPCPFCGHENLSVVGRGYPFFVVECDTQGCGIYGPRRLTEEDALIAWNTRDLN